MTFSAKWRTEASLSKKLNYDQDQNESKNMEEYEVILGMLRQRWIDWNSWGIQPWIQSTIIDNERQTLINEYCFFFFILYYIFYNNNIIIVNTILGHTTSFSEQTNPPNHYYSCVHLLHYYIIHGTILQIPFPQTQSAIIQLRGKLTKWTIKL